MHAPERQADRRRTAGCDEAHLSRRVLGCHGPAPPTVLHAHARGSRVLSAERVRVVRDVCEKCMRRNLVCACASHLKLLELF